MRKAIAQVGQHLYLENRIGLGEKGGGVSADRRFGIQHEDAGIIVAFQAELSGGADHALGVYAADLGLLKLALGEQRAHLGKRDLLADGDVLGAADYAHGRLAVVHIHQRQLVGVGVLVYLHYLAYADAAKGRPGLVQPFHLEPDAVKLGRHIFRRRRVLQKIAEPGIKDFHN